MNLSVKYRGQTKDGSWVYGSLVTTAVGLTYIVPQNLISDELEPLLVESKSVGRYVGIKDRYGKDIYQGHLVQYTKILYSDFAQSEIEKIGETIIGEIYYAEGIWLGIRCKDESGRLLLPGTVHTKGPNLQIEIIGDGQSQLKKEQEAI